MDSQWVMLLPHSDYVFDIFVKTLQVVPEPFWHVLIIFLFPFFPNNRMLQVRILYFLCSSPNVTHFSKEHGSCQYLEIKIWVRGVHISGGYYRF